MFGDTGLIDAVSWIGPTIVRGEGAVFGDAALIDAVSWMGSAIVRGEAKAAVVFEDTSVICMTSLSETSAGEVRGKTVIEAVCGGMCAIGLGW